MANYFDRITVSLFGKLVIIFGFLIVSGSGIFWYTASRTDKRDLMDNSVAFIASFSEMIYKSIKHDMISNRREDIRMALESIGASESITNRTVTPPSVTSTSGTNVSLES